ncbi:hypothetical protein JHK85_038211 [Glycine max]|nr:hypothetical protein JHK85_038211 [Glycine max]
MHHGSGNYRNKEAQICCACLYNIGEKKKAKKKILIITKESLKWSYMVNLSFLQSSLQPFFLPPWFL